MEIIDCKEQEKRFIVTGKILELSPFKGHGVTLWRFSWADQKYLLVEVGRLMTDEENKYCVSGRSNTAFILVSDIIEHNKQICRYGLGRYVRG